MLFLSCFNAFLYVLFQNIYNSIFYLSIPYLFLNIIRKTIHNHILKDSQNIILFFSNFWRFYYLNFYTFLAKIYLMFLEIYYF